MKSRNFNNIEIAVSENILTGNQLFDKWFSKDGGIVPGSVIFVTGTSGAGKTTLMVNLMNWLKNHKSSLYSREMKIGSLKQQVKDYDFDNDKAFFADEDDCPHVKNYIDELSIIKPEIVIVDSLQAIACVDYPEFSEEKGSIHVREILTKWCKDNNSTLFIIGHNTKDNEFAGKNTNMQMVDAHMVLEYDKKTETRKMFWGKKNRKGPMGQLFYEINDGEITFHESEPPRSFHNGNISISEELKEFFSNFIRKLSPTDPRTIRITEEINQINDSLYRKYKENESEYMFRLSIEILTILKRYNVL